NQLVIDGVIALDESPSRSAASATVAPCSPSLRCVVRGLRCFTTIQRDCSQQPRQNPFQSSLLEHVLQPVFQAILGKGVVAPTGDKSGRVRFHGGTIFVQERRIKGHSPPAKIPLLFLVSLASGLRVD